jgi:broad specificity phosphatase PhoE
LSQKPSFLRQGERILREHIVIDRIITSPAKRAIHTAEIIAAVIGIEQGDIKTDKRLVEYDLGELDGKSARGVTARERVTASGAEDPVAFQRRVMSSINDMKKLSDNTLLVSHDAVGRIIKANPTWRRSL